MAAGAASSQPWRKAGSVTYSQPCRAATALAAMQNIRCPLPPLFVAVSRPCIRAEQPPRRNQKPAEPTILSYYYRDLCISPQLQGKPIVSHDIYTTNFLHHFRPFLSHGISKSLLPRASSISSSAADYPTEHVADNAKGKQSTTRQPWVRIAEVEQDDLVDPKTLADNDSFFCKFNGVDLHHKICHYEEIEEEVKETVGGQRLSLHAKVQIPMILLHGFGASTFSWDRVMKPLAQLVRSKVLAFDRPAFGLTARTFRDKGDDALVRPLNPYSMAFSVLATHFFIDLLTTGKNKGEKRAILMGHSAGCLVAVETYFEAPEKVAALILVAPAIVAPLNIWGINQEKKMGKGNQKENGHSDVSVPPVNPFMMFWNFLTNFYMHLVRVTLEIWQGMRDMIGSLYIKALSVLLRSTFSVVLVRMIMNKFGLLAIRYAWSDPSQITDYVIQGYTKPLKAKGWEMALLEYTLAVLTESSSKPPLSARLSQISCPVLIVTGDSDRIVPPWNAKHLSRAISGSCFEVIKNCGHLPHEEKVEEFLLIVEKFLQRTFGVPNELFIQAAA
ncbi:hypothetical protein Cni_G21287 [Canna indica]|uniref:AB hydrolase-1 domain-containing protein n=1 Tax=Canna indica TaxID=4628 RepID=A0AAQ3KPX5_9LILI|nr:hypothetical protein Cni_G21287 [Canna indica]